MTTLAEHGAALHEVLSDLTTLSVSDLVKLWRQLDGSSRIVLKEVLPQVLSEVVIPYMTAAATVTAQWYDELDPSSAYTAPPVVDLPAERISGTVQWALFAPGGADPLARLSGASKRMVLDGSRQTVVENASIEGVRWARQAQPSACAFCRLLATRTTAADGLYRSKAAATTAVGRPRNRRTRAPGDKYHDHCRCIAVPIRGGTYEPPDYVASWQNQYLAARKAVGGNTTKILAHMRAAGKTAE